MRFNSLKGPLLLLVSIAAAATAASDEKTPFRTQPPADYPHHQTSESVTIAAQPFETDDEAREPFGKVNPFRLGILPVLLVVQNGGRDALRLENMKVIYELPDQTRVEATPAQDLKYLRGPRQPSVVPGPAVAGIKLGRTPKNPLAEWQIEGRAFAAKMIPPGETASGFVYFQVPQTSAAASVYISGLSNAVTGKELFYFEIPMSGK